MPLDAHLPDDLSLERPSPARMYDYFLGGYHNFEVDRIAAQKVMEVNPDAPLVMQANRAFLRRAVTFCLRQGITQFLDLGSGIPTIGSVHEVVQPITPTARIVYVDIDVVAVRHSEAILAAHPMATIIHADVRQPERVLNHPDVRRVLDFQQPIAVLLVALLHFVRDDAEAAALVHVLRDALVPGSYLVLSHATYENVPSSHLERIKGLYARTSQPVEMRSRTQIAHFFDGWDLLEPGVVYVPCWHPESEDDLLLDQPARSVNLAGVGRKPDPQV